MTSGLRGKFTRQALAIVASFWLLPHPGFGAGTPAGYQEYIVPFDEDIFAYITDPLVNVAVGANYTTQTVISITAWTDAVTIYYDHWENGYNFDPLNPDATTDEKYTLNQGQTLSFQSAATPRPRTGADGNSYIGAAGNCNAQVAPAASLIRNTLNFCYDGRDRVYTVGGATTLTRGGWINSPNPPPELGIRAAVGEEVFPLAPQLIKYILPFGESNTRADYNRVSALIQATEDNTTLQIDFNGDGTFDGFNPANGYRTARTSCAPGCLVTSITLNRGQSYILDQDSDGTLGGLLPAGIVILGSKTLQVEYFYGQANAGIYDTRAISAYPRGFWSNEYYAPADGAAAGNTDILLYNPNNSAITVNWETATTTGTFNIAASTSTFFQANSGIYVPQGSAVYLKGTGTFWGTSDVDSNSGNYDWGYSLVPTYLLQTDQNVSYAPGNSPVLACNDAGGQGRANGLFITPAQDNTTIFIDKNGDGVPDTDASMEVLLGTTPVAATGLGYRANRLQSLYVTGSSSGTTAGSLCDLTGAHVWATGPFTMAYGENPDKATAVGGLDLGYTILPGPDNWMDLALTTSKTTNPVIVSTVAGATTVTYTIVVDSHEFNIDAVNVVDNLPANWAFVNNSATITYPNLSQTTGAAANPTVALPNLTWGSGLLGNLLPNQRITITFQAVTTAVFTNGAITQNNVTTTGTRTVGGVTQTFKAKSLAFNTYSDGSFGMNVTKTSSVPLATPVSPGDTLTYTVTVANPATNILTAATLYDALPNGVTYVAASGSVTCELPRNVRDEFAAAAYTNNGPNNTNNWATNWTETDAFGSGATGAGGGFVLVTGNALQFRYQTDSSADNFNGADYTNSTGTRGWSGAWTETSDDGSATTGTIRLDNPVVDQLNFIQGTAGRSIARTASLGGATSVNINFTLTDGGIDAGETVVAEYDIGSGFVTIGTLDGGAGYTGSALPLTVNTTGATSITLRFRAPQAWNEANDDVQIEDVSITFNNSVGAQIQRTVNLAGMQGPRLNFTTATANLVATDTLVVEASTSAAGPFTTLATYNGATPTVAPPYDLTPYISATTTIRYRITGGYNATNKTFGIDNVDVSYGQPSTFASGNPPDFLGSTTGCRISPANSLTLTFNVTVDNPFPNGQTDILNIVSAGASQIPLPITASARNIVLVPNVGTGTVGDRVWLDSDGNGLLDPGETGLAGIEVTLKDQFGTPLQVTTTDSLGRYLFSNVPPGNGYFVSVTGGLPAPSALGTVADAFNTNGVFTGSTGTLPWLTNWSETGDDNTATGGTIRIANNRIEFTASAAGALIQRSATVPATTTAVALQYSWNFGGGLSATTDDILVEYSTDGVAWNTLRTLNGGIAAGTFTDNITWNPANGTIFLRYRALNALEAGEQGLIDNVQMSFAAPTLVQTTDSRTDLRINAFNLTSGQNYLNADIGFKPNAGTAAFGDLVWSDADGDGVRDPGEPGLSGVTVQLYRDANGNGILDVGTDTLVGTTTSSASGSYLFSGAPASGTQTYFVNATTPGGYLSTGPLIYRYTNVAAGSSNLTADFSFWQAAAGTTFSITDRVWLDNGAGGGTTNDGIRNGAEPGISGVTVSLLNSSGSIIASTTTDSNGIFAFTGVPAGQNYSWQITDSAGILTNYFGTTTSAQTGTFQMTGNLTGNLDFSPNPLPHFGYNATRAIGDTVFNDLNGNGVQDSGEPGIQGVVVSLYRDVNGNGVIDAGGPDTLIGTLTTDANGQYLFAGLSNASYIVSVPTPAGFTYTQPGQPADSDGTAAGIQRGATIVGSANVLTADFGFRASTPRTLSGVIWKDANSDGTIGGGESRISGVTVDILSGTTVVATVTTDATGTYTVPGLASGTYTVRVTDTNSVMIGLNPTYEVTGGTGGPFDHQESVNLTAGNVTNVNFGFKNPTPTYANISNLRAFATNRAVYVGWDTTSEIGSASFRLERSAVDPEKWEGVGPAIMPALPPFPTGASYQVTDPTAALGATYRYRIVERETRGGVLVHGPYLVTVGASPGATLLNPNAAGYGRVPKTLPGARVIRPTVESSALPFSTSSWKATLREEGVYAVSLSGPSGPSSPKTHRLTNLGNAVAVGNDLAQRRLLFYGTELKSIHATSNAYLLKPGLPTYMREVNGKGPAPLAQQRSFPFTRHFEEDAIAGLGWVYEQGQDFWFWKTFIAEDPTYNSADISLDLKQVDSAGGPATIALEIHGLGDPTVAAAYHVTALVNGNNAGELQLAGSGPLKGSLVIDASRLQEGLNTLHLEAVLDQGLSSSWWFLNSIDVTYPRLFRASSNEARVRAGTRQQVVTVDGFTTPDIVVFDVTEPTNPVWIRALNVQGTGSAYSVSFARTGRSSDYYLVGGERVRNVSLQQLVDAGLKGRTAGAEHVVIAPYDLLEAGQRLVDQRNSQHLPSTLVPLEAIWDEFGEGIPSPSALKSFLDAASTSWSPAPRYVVLAGRGTYDERNLYGFGDNLIPTFFVGTERGLTGNDSEYVRGTGAVIGRIPVTAAAAMSSYVDKLVAHENLGLSPATTFAADDTDQAGDFASSSDTVASTVPGAYAIQKTYLGPKPFDQVHGEVLSALGRGDTIVNWVGHGSLDRLADEGVVTNDDLASLPASTRLSLFTGATCNVNSFFFVASPSFGERLTTMPFGGSLASFAPSGVAYNEMSVSLMRGFLGSALAGSAQRGRLGDAIRTTRESLPPGPLADAFSLFQLLGDPGCYFP